MAVTDLLSTLGISVPIVLAPMASATSPELCAAVSSAGGLGLLPVWHRDAKALREGVHAVRALTNRPFGVNLNNNYPQDEQLGAAIDEGVGLVSFFWGLDKPRLKRARDAGMMTMQTIGSAAEAQEAVDAGADIIVAQGWESGGHVWSTVATMALVPTVVDAVPSTPVIAAGGIADGRGLAAVLALGASAGWIGTRFLLAHESPVDAEKREIVRAAIETTTAIGKDANPEWFDSGIRWIGPESNGSYRPSGVQLAGQGVALVNREQPAAEIVEEIWREAQATMKALGQRAV
jgi:nitronate monooxygenase